MKSQNTSLSASIASYIALGYSIEEPIKKISRFYSKKDRKEKLLEEENGPINRIKNLLVYRIAIFIPVLPLTSFSTICITTLTLLLTVCMITYKSTIILPIIKIHNYMHIT